MRELLVALFVCLPVLAFAQAPQIKRTNPPTLSTPNGYTHVVEVIGPGKLVYIAGQLGLDKSGKMVGTDMKAQAEQVFKNLEAALAAAGAKFSDVVKLNTYVTDVGQIQAYRDVRGKYFGNQPPASTLVQIVHLALPEAVLEVEAVAVVGGK